MTSYTKRHSETTSTVFKHLKHTVPLSFPMASGPMPASACIALGTKRRALHSSNTQEQNSRITTNAGVQNKLSAHSQKGLTSCLLFAHGNFMGKRWLLMLRNLRINLTAVTSWHILQRSHTINIVWKWLRNCCHKSATTMKPPYHPADKQYPSKHWFHDVI